MLREQANATHSKTLVKDKLIGNILNWNDDVWILLNIITTLDIGGRFVGWSSMHFLAIANTRRASCALYVLSGMKKSTSITSPFFALSTRCTISCSMETRRISGYPVLMRQAKLGISEHLCWKEIRYSWGVMKTSYSNKERRGVKKGEMSLETIP